MDHVGQLRRSDSNQRTVRSLTIENRLCVFSCQKSRNRLHGPAKLNYNGSLYSGELTECGFEVSKLRCNRKRSVKICTFALGIFEILIGSLSACLEDVEKLGRRQQSACLHSTEVGKRNMVVVHRK